MALVSLHPDDAVEGGGLSLDGKIATIRSIYAMERESNRADFEATVGFRIDLEDEEGTVYDHEPFTDSESAQYYSMGSVKTWQVAEGGRGIEPVHEGTRVRNSCNAHHLMAAFLNCQVPAEVLQSGDVSTLEGWTFEWAATSVKGDGEETRKRQDGREAQVILPRRLVSEGGGGGGRGRGRQAAPQRGAAARGGGAAARGGGGTATAEREPRGGNNGAAGAAELADEVGEEHEALFKEWLTEEINASDQGAVEQKALVSSAFKATKRVGVKVPGLRVVIEDPDALENMGFLVDRDSGLVALG